MLTLQDIQLTQPSSRGLSTLKKKKQEKKQKKNYFILVFHISREISSLFLVQRLIINYSKEKLVEKDDRHRYWHMDMQGHFYLIVLFVGYIIYSNLFIIDFLDSSSTIHDRSVNNRRNERGCRKTILIFLFK